MSAPEPQTLLFGTVVYGDGPLATDDPAELFHEVLEHRWYLSERAGHDIPIEDAIKDYVATVLPGKPDEATVVGVDTVEMPVLAMFDDD